MDTNEKKNVIDKAPGKVANPAVTPDRKAEDPVPHLTKTSDPVEGLRPDEINDEEKDEGLGNKKDKSQAA